MQIEKTHINQALHHHIGEAHAEAKSDVLKAQEAIDTAFKQTARVGALIEKASKIHKQDLFGFMADHMSSQEVRNYLSFYDEYSKRGGTMTKRQLVTSGMWQQQQLELRDVTPKRIKRKSFISTIGDLKGKLNKYISERPITEWGQNEKDQIRHILKPLYELYNTL